MGRLDEISDWEERAARAKFQLSRLAADCHVSERQLRRHIEKTYRVPPHVWMMELRLRGAPGLLRRGARIKELADKLYFKSAEHFSHAFKKHYGVAPSSLRRKARRRDKTGEISQREL